MKVYKSSTEMEETVVNKMVESNCTAIMFRNESVDTRNADGDPVGYFMVINNIVKLLPRESVTFNQAPGFVDTSIYSIAFVAQAETVAGTQRGTITRINTIQGADKLQSLNAGKPLNC